MECMMANDPSSQSNINHWITKHIEFDLKVDFVDKQIKGTVNLLVNKVGEHKDDLYLDTRDLSIEIVLCNNEKVEFLLHPCSGCFGSKLQLNLHRFVDASELNLQIKYTTSPKSSALQWLTPLQTCGKEHPYMFSQCQAIHARSFFPCQDSPAIKATYSAKITAPKALTVLMSAIHQEINDVDDNCRAFTFEQKVPIPSYLVAIVCGHLESRQVGRRCKVWSEPDMVEKCAFEFSETEKMLEVAEELCGPYVWGIYDLLILPPSFPYGGMENPCLTFVTPTLLAGDRSLANVVAHEIAHSWTGNLVTNRTWEHFWLNEGHTVFLERKIMSRLEGEPHRHLQMLCGRQSLTEEVHRRGMENSMTALLPNLEGVDPDDAFSCVPYEKGSGLLYYIECLVTEERMNKWLRAYIDEFAHKSIDTAQWKEFLFSFFSSKLDRDALNCVDWDLWLKQPGNLPETPVLDATLSDDAHRLVLAWLTSKKESADREGATYRAFNPRQCMLFLDELRTLGPPSRETVELIGEYYDLPASKNAEILFRWLLLGLKVHSEDCVEPAIEFLNEQGRMKFTRPLYRALYDWPEMKELACNNFREQHLRMHPITAQMVGQDIGVSV